MATKITKQRLQCLGHVARIPNHRMPKIALFGWLPQTRPPEGPCERWKDQIRKDLKSIASWKQSLNHHQQRQGKEVLTQSQDRVWCQLCQRSFRRESDRKRHKCLEERFKPVWKQRGAVQCMACQQWFCSKGGLTVHRCCS